jgi:hypothetical protein
MTRFNLTKKLVVLKSQLAFKLKSRIMWEVVVGSGRKAPVIPASDALIG